MSIYIHAISTLVPPGFYTQIFARDRMMSWTEDPRIKRLTRRVYDRSGIDKRHSVVQDFQPGVEPVLFKSDGSGLPPEPSTQERNRVFIRESRRLSVDVAGAALQRCRGIRAEDVTHVITVSCTGFYNPGPDYDVVTGLGLRGAVERYHLGFMGCYAAFPAFRMAKQFCEADPSAVVLIVCVELCSLHLQVRGDLEGLLGNALFADGAAAAVVSGRDPEGPVWVLDRFFSCLAEEGKADMAWEIGDRGFNLVLSSYVPNIIATNIGAIMEAAGLEAASIHHWAVHPGGKAILDKVEQALALSPDALDASRAVLREYGNMSSATILFVLEGLQAVKAGERICAMAFGPGLTIEMAVLSGTRVTSGVREEARSGAEVCASFSE